ncbi:MAG: hypothetical protein QXQ81_05845 [Candidatus Thorarchaeota archaeon]
MVRIGIGVKTVADANVSEEGSFELFCDVDDNELIDLRKFIDPEIDLSPLDGIDLLFDKLNHLID